MRHRRSSISREWPRSSSSRQIRMLGDQCRQLGSNKPSGGRFEHRRTDLVSLHPFASHDLIGGHWLLIVIEMGGEDVMNGRAYSHCAEGKQAVAFNGRLLAKFPRSGCNRGFISFDGTTWEIPLTALLSNQQNPATSETDNRRSSLQLSIFLIPHMHAQLVMTGSVSASL